MSCDKGGIVMLVQAKEAKDFQQRPEAKKKESSVVYRERDGEREREWP